MTRPSDAIRAVIVDDEPLARALLREHLAAHPEVDVVAECANGFEAVKAVAELAPDLVFLDIQMPKLDGFEVLELIGREHAVIFVTAFDKYAIRAFEVHAVDYLLKPFPPERLAAALGRAHERLAARGAGRRPGPEPAALAAAARPPGRRPERIFVRDGAKVVVIPLDKLDYAESQDDYVALVSEGRRHLKQQTLADLETQLDPARFIRIHRGYILNVDRLVRIEPYAKDSRVAILADGTRLPVSRTGHQRLREFLDGAG